MKIIHTADVHIGSPIKNLPYEKAKLRRMESITAFRFVADYAKANGVFAVLICGDLFDECTLSPHVVQETLSIISSAPEVCFFYCQGNHDQFAPLQGELPKNLFTFGDAHGWKSYQLTENVVVSGIDGVYLTDEAYARLQLPPSSFNVVMVHGELSTVIGKDRVCLPLLQNKCIDYLALGHIHNPDRTAQPLHARGVYRYSGSLMSRGFDECGAKGFYEIEIANGRICREAFVVVPTVRAVHEYTIDVSAYQTVEQLHSAVFSALQAQRSQDVVKVTLKGNCVSNVKQRLYMLDNALSERFFFCKLDDKTTLALENADLLRRSPILTEFTKLLSAHPQYSAQKEELIDVAIKALTGENLDV